METEYKSYKIIGKFSEVKQLVKYCKQTGYCSSDFESWGTNSMYPGSYPTILGVSFQPGSAWIIPLGHYDSPFKHDWKKVLRYFGREIIENPDIIKIGQNIKYEMNWWRKYGITMVGRVFDTMLAKYLLDEERPHGLKSMVSRFIPEYQDYDLEGRPGDKATTQQLIDFWSNVSLEKLSKYCALDSDLTFRLWLFFEPKLIEYGFYPLFRNMMMMASRVLAEVEWEGMNIDRDYLKGLLESYKIKIDSCEKRLRNISLIKKYEKKNLKLKIKKLIQKTQDEIEELEDEGASQISIKNRQEKISRYIAREFTTNKEKDLLEKLNFNSPAQMIDLLFVNKFGFDFDIVKYTIDKKTKRETDRPSTDEEVLLELKLQDETGFIDNLLELRALTKMYSTYVLGMWNKMTSKNKVHGSFLLHGTTTGRLSSKSPNLQNIPRITSSSDIKQMFITPKGKLFFQLDYSQAELRVLAAAAKEETMIEWFRIGRDIHLASACHKMNWDYDEKIKIWEDESHELFEETKIERKKAKTLNFGIVYGQTAKKLAINLSTEGHKVSEREAQEFLNDFNRRFPKVNKYIKKQHRLAEKNGYVYNLFGRKRRLDNVYSDNWGKQAEALRQAVNCVDKFTEALSIEGWKSYDQLKEGEIILTKNKDTGMLEWQPIQKLNIYPDYTGDMYLFENGSIYKGKSISALTTPNHRWLCKNETKRSRNKLLIKNQKRIKLVDEDNITKERINLLISQGFNPKEISVKLGINYIKVRRILDLTKKTRQGPLFRPLIKPTDDFITSEKLSETHQVKSIHLNGNYSGNKIKKYSDSLVEFIGWILTDGSISYYNTPKKPRQGKPHRVSLTQSFIANPKKVSKIRDLLIVLDFKYTEKKVHRAYVWKFPKYVAVLLDEIIPRKMITMEFLLGLTKYQLKLLLYTIRLGDGIKITTVNKNHLDMFQVLVVLAGKSSNTLTKNNVGKKSYSDKLLNQEYIVKRQPSYHITIHKRNYVHHRNTRGKEYFKLIKD